jgi:hypothetical protein
MAEIAQARANSSYKSKGIPTIQHKVRLEPYDF